MNNTLSLFRTFSKREKFYFKKLHKTSSDKNFFKLYTYIEKNSNSSIADIKKAFSGTSIEKNIHSELHLLYKQLLRTLQIYRLNSKSTSFTILSDLQNAQILIEKKMFKASRVILMRAKKSAYHEEEFSILIKIISMLEAIDIGSYDSDRVSKYKLLGQERSDCMAKIENHMQLKLLRSKVTDIQFSEGLFVHDPEKFKNILFSPLFEDPDFAQSIQAKDHWNTAKSIATLLLGEYDKSTELCLNNIELVGTHLQIFSQFDLLKAYNNLLFVCLISEKFHLFEEHFKTLADFENSTSISKVDLYFYIYYLGIRYQVYLKEPNQDLLSDMITQSDEFINKNDAELTAAQKDQLFFSNTLAYMKLCKFEEALKLLNLWNSSTTGKMTYAIRKTMQLVVYFEVGFYKLLESDIESFAKSIKRKKIESQTYALLIEFLKEFVKSPDSFPLNDFISRLKVLSMQKSEKKYFLEFNLLNWAIGRQER